MRIRYEDCRYCKGRGEVCGMECRVCRGMKMIAIAVQNEEELEKEKSEINN